MSNRIQTASMAYAHGTWYRDGNRVVVNNRDRLPPGMPVRRQTEREEAPGFWSFEVEGWAIGLDPRPNDGLNPPESDFALKVKRAALQRAMYYGTRCCAETALILAKLINTCTVPPENQAEAEAMHEEALRAEFMLQRG